MRQRISQDLTDADELLTKFGRWAQDRYRKRRCASAEGRYKIPAYRNTDGPPEPMLADLRAMNVHRALLMLPVRYRRVLHAHYIPKGLPPDAQRRALGVPARAWDEDLVSGVRMFWNFWRLHFGHGKG